MQTHPADGQSRGSTWPSAAAAEAWVPEVASDVAAGLDVVASAHPLATVLGFLAEIIERHEPGAHATVLIAAEDGRTLLHAAAPSLPAEFTRAVDQLAIPPEAMPGDARWRELSRAHGLQCCWALPI